MKIPFSLIAFYLGFLVLGLAISFSLNTGGSPNPARDLSPRILSYIAGWGIQVFRYIDNSQDLTHFVQH